MWGCIKERRGGGFGWFSPFKNKTKQFLMQLTFLDSQPVFCPSPAGSHYLCLAFHLALIGNLNDCWSLDAHCAT